MSFSSDPFLVKTQIDVLQPTGRWERGNGKAAFSYHPDSDTVRNFSHYGLIPVIACVLSLCLNKFRLFNWISFRQLNTLLYVHLC